ncbi:unnamed protein product, partial [Cladocopium goreaui]
TNHSIQQSFDVKQGAKGEMRPARLNAQVCAALLLRALASKDASERKKQIQKLLGRSTV